MTHLDPYALDAPLAAEGYEPPPGAPPLEPTPPARVTPPGLMTDADFLDLVPPSLRPGEHDPAAHFLAAGRRLAAEHGEALTFAAFQKATRISQREVRLWFNGWSNLRVALGLRPHPRVPRNVPTDEEVLDRLRTLVADEGPDVTLARFCVVTGWSSMLVQRRFGTFAAMRTALGLSPRPASRKRVSAEDVVADVARVWAELGRPDRFPSVSAYERRGRHSRSTVYQRFESWAEVEVAVRALP